MIKVIIPAYNEEESISKVLNDIPSLVDEVIVVNNGSTDATAQRAKDAGATVISEPRRGYGYACLAGMEHIASCSALPDIVVFLDGDYSDYPEEL
ncbi:MAG TPA: UDP-glucose--dolichyl-phosphate glucosyltransferase, partial [Bacteroidetes bacterium]|nr:UDP-glucose--dolichyl-phosphate glucosyltransferase [Bacteroidota bacterium]